MNKLIHIFLCALIFGLAQSVPLPNATQLNDLETVLLLPESEIKMHTAIVAEDLPMLEKKLLNETATVKPVESLVKQVQEAKVKSDKLEQKIEATEAKVDRLEEALTGKKTTVEKVMRSITDNLNKTIHVETAIESLMDEISSKTNKTEKIAKLQLDNLITKQELKSDILEVNALGSQLKNDSLVAVKLVEEMQANSVKAENLMDLVVLDTKKAATLVETMKTQNLTEGEATEAQLAKLIEETKGKETRIATIVSQVNTAERELERIVRNMEINEVKAKLLLEEQKREAKKARLAERREQLKSLLVLLKEEKRNRTAILKQLQEKKLNLTIKNETSQHVQTELGKDLSLLSKLQDEIVEDHFKIENLTLSIADETINAKIIEKHAMTKALKAEKLTEQLFDVLDRTEARAEDFNKTARLVLMNEHLNITKRMKILVENLNKTEREHLKETELKILNLQEDIMRDEANVSRLENYSKRDENKIVKLESEISEDLKSYKLLLDEIKSQKLVAEKLENQIRSDLGAVKQLEEQVKSQETKKTELIGKFTEIKAKNVKENLKIEMLEDEEEIVSKNRTVREILESVLVDKTKLEDDEMLARTVCDSTVKFQYVQPHPFDAKKFIECDPWNNGTIKTCPDNKKFDAFHAICSEKDMFEIGRNLTMDLEALERNQKIMSGLNCNNSQFTCINGGVCVPVKHTFQCNCTKKFTGDLCEIKIIKNSIFSEIMSGKFVLDTFKTQLASAIEKKEITPAEMNNIRSSLKNSTHEEIMNYLGLFKKGEVRYDIVMNNLIEKILEDIYPDAYYLSFFNSSAETFLSVVHTLPSVISYSKYSKVRYVEVFFRYQQVLDKLETVLNNTWPGVGKQASEYMKITALILNETKVLDSLFQNVKVSKEEINTKLDAEFNSTMEAEAEFVMNLEALRLKSIAIMKSKPELAEQKLIDVNIPEAKQIVAIFQELSVRSAQLITSLMSFGFWALSEALSL